MSDRRAFLLVLLLMFLVAARPASAVCLVDADVAATPNDDPALPAWTYEVNLTWYNATGVDHWMLLLDFGIGQCTCADLTNALVLPQPAGSSLDTGGSCTVSYASTLECAGDPRSTLTGFMITFTPTTGPTCVPGIAGTGSFIFQSELPPTPVDESAPFYVANLNLQRCAGAMTGVFPSIPCDPLATESRSWGALKGMYR